MLNDCKILKDLPQGGQKTVQLAEHPTIGLVVIKKGAINSFTSLERINREIELLSELKSEYYPQQYHFNIDIKTKEFEIVEDYIEGDTLRDSMKLFSNVDQIFSLLYTLIEGLSIIWERNIVHRDLKPENIIIRKNGMPCIIDLGIARFLEMESLTKTISPIGPCTPIYASPEQLTNNKNIIDHRTDFFCLGIISLELFLGVHPFDPTYLENHFSIVENILQNKFLLETKQVKRDDRIEALADKTLKQQPFERFRNHQMFKSFIEKHLTK
jgi:eukaryotic-like serine/threonine-protein kinase